MDVLLSNIPSCRLQFEESCTKYRVNVFNMGGKYLETRFVSKLEDLVYPDHEILETKLTFPTTNITLIKRDWIKQAKRIHTISCSNVYNIEFSGKYLIYQKFWVNSGHVYNLDTQRHELQFQYNPKRFVILNHKIYYYCRQILWMIDLNSFKQTKFYTFDEVIKNLLKIESNVILIHIGEKWYRMNIILKSLQEESRLPTRGTFKSVGKYITQYAYNKLTVYRNYKKILEMPRIYNYEIHPMGYCFVVTKTYNAFMYDLHTSEKLQTFINIQIVRLLHGTNYIKLNNYMYKLDLDTKRLVLSDGPQVGKTSIMKAHPTRKIFTTTPSSGIRIYA